MAVSSQAAGHAPQRLSEEALRHYAVVSILSL